MGRELPPEEGRPSTSAPSASTDWSRRMDEFQSLLCGRGYGFSAAGDGDRRKRRRRDAFGVKGFLDHSVGSPPDHELLAWLGHHLHANLDGEVAELLDPLHLRSLEDVRRELGITLQL